MTNNQMAKPMYIVEVDYDNTRITDVKILHMFKGKLDKRTIPRRVVVTLLGKKRHIRTLSVDSFGGLHSARVVSLRKEDNVFITTEGNDTTVDNLSDLPAIGKSLLVEQIKDTADLDRIEPALMSRLPFR